MIHHTPAEILRRMMINDDVAAPLSELPSTAWSIFIGHLPDKPDNAICIYDTTGIKTGRQMPTGKTTSKPGWQVRVRGMTYVDAYSKIIDICDWMDTVLRKTVTVEYSDYEVQVLTQVGTVLPLGRELEGKKREHFTINGIMTYKAT